MCYERHLNEILLRVQGDEARLLIGFFLQRSRINGIRWVFLLDEIYKRAVLSMFPVIAEKLQALRLSIPAINQIKASYP